MCVSVTAFKFCSKLAGLFYSEGFNLQSKYGVVGTLAAVNGFMLKRQFGVCVLMCAICFFWLLKAYEM